MTNKKGKLKLSQLRVNSFTTDLQREESEKVKGGITFITVTIYSDIMNCAASDEPTGCSGLCCGTLTTSGDSGAFGPVCFSEYPNCGFE
ncbi:MAG: pinensin family lanthipeptide [Cyclobacteriaceae bacterium]